MKKDIFKGIPIVPCDCKGCREEREALRKQMDHPFYKEAENFRNEVKRETMVKASKKYPEPFDPNSWTIEQLGKHAMAENYDQENYIFGMLERLRSQEKEIAALKAQNLYLIDFIEFVATHNIPNIPQLFLKDQAHAVLKVIAEKNKRRADYEKSEN